MMFFNVKIPCFPGKRKQQVKHLYVDFPKRYGSLNYNHHCKMHSRCTLLFYFIACISFEEFRSSWCQIRPVWVYLGWAYVSRWPREQQVVWEPETHTHTQHCPSFAKLHSYVPWVKQIHYRESVIIINGFLWLEIRSVSHKEVEIHPSGNVSVMYLLILQNICIFLMNSCYCSAVLHMASEFAYVALNDLSYNPSSAKTVYPSLIFLKLFTMFNAWIRITHRILIPWFISFQML